MKTRVLITAGPTREYIDPVRYISNDSSGRMGFALAKGAHELGADVTLIAGPVTLAPPDGVKAIGVMSARDMHMAVIEEAPKADIVIMVAAVSDWRPRRYNRNKIKKGSKPPTLALTENPDILAELCKKRTPGQTIVGFALETANLEKNARRKLKKKGCDWIVANGSRAIGAATTGALLIHRDGKKVSLPCLPKDDLAVIILSHVMC